MLKDNFFIKNIKNKPMILFDLDGTLAHTQPDILRAIRKTLRRYSFQTRPLREIRAFFDQGVIDMLRCGSLQPLTDDELKILRDDLFKRYATIHSKRTKTWPHVKEMLTFLTKIQWPMGICTNKTEQAARLTLCHLHIEHFFKCIVGSDTLRDRFGSYLKKPHPDLFYYAADILNAQNCDKIMVGDTLTDMHFAHESGAKFIWAAFGYGKEDSIFHTQCRYKCDDMHLKNFAVMNSFSQLISLIVDLK